MIEEKEPSSRVKREASTVKRHKKWRRVLPPIIAASMILLVMVYISALLFSRNGSFTIAIKDYGDREYSLSLSESDDFRTQSSRLNASAIKNITNIDGNTLPGDLNDVDGAHNGGDYLAYTFYLKNTGEKSCSYKYSLVIAKATVGVDAAARVRVYYNADYYKSESGAYDYSSAYTDYAKPKTGGNGQPEVDPDNRVMTNFASNDVVVEKQVDNFAPGDKAKITVVIWLEGNDPDCTDDVLGGQFKLDMIMEIVG